MTGLLTHVIPLIGGYFMKLIAINQENKSQERMLEKELLILSLGGKADARKAEREESPMSAFNRRVFIFSAIALFAFVQTVPVFFDVPTVVPTVREGFSLLGIQITPDEVEYVTVKGMLLIQETRSVFAMIAELWFGGQMAKGR